MNQRHLLLVWGLSSLFGRTESMGRMVETEGLLDISNQVYFYKLV